MMFSPVALRSEDSVTEENLTTRVPDECPETAPIPTVVETPRNCRVRATLDAEVVKEYVRLPRPLCERPRMPLDDRICACGLPLQTDDAFCGACGRAAEAPRRIRAPVVDLVRQQLEGITKGRYEILAELGRGGFGSVYLANERALARRVAIKVLSARQIDDNIVERFYREARMQAGL